MSYTRKKKVAIDGAEFVIAPLTIEQVERLIAPLEDLQKDQAAIAGVYDLVCTGLNNATGLSGDSESWTKDRIKREIDQFTLAWLQNQILEFSGLRAQPEGESSAAAPATS
jgi:hypothetical protein